VSLPNGRKSASYVNLCVPGAHRHPWNRTAGVVLAIRGNAYALRRQGLAGPRNQTDPDLSHMESTAQDSGVFNRGAASNPWMCAAVPLPQLGS